MRNTKNKGSLAAKNKILLIIGFLFFINPLFRGVDILPDVFGCLIIYFALTQLAFFDSSIEAARKGFLYLAIVEGIRLLMMKSILLTQVSSNRLLAVTSFAIVNGILYVMIFRQFFGGLNYFSMRNNCMTAMNKCDGAAFITYIAFFARLVASIIPELLSLVEILLYADEGVDISLEKLDMIADLMVAKPLIELFFMLLAFGIAVPWFISMCSLISTFSREAGAELDARYAAEYTAKPTKARIKRLKQGIYIFYFALAFSLDLTFNGIRYIPASAMFLFLVIGALVLKPISDFSKTIKFSVIVFCLLLGAEIFRIYALPYKSMAVYQTPLLNVILGCVICLLVLPLCLFAVRIFLSDVANMAKSVSGKDISTKGSWVAYCCACVLWSVGYCVPYLYSSISTLRLIASGIFIWQTVKVLGYIRDAEEERIALYGE